MPNGTAVAEEKSTGFVRGLGLYDSTMLVAGSMIGSGIFIVSADISRQVGAPAWLLVVWIVTGLLTLAAALSYGELAAMMPKAGGQYVYLREAFSPLWGFLYGWTLFLVIQTGTIAAVAVGFARYMGVLWPRISEDKYLIEPFSIGGDYRLSLSTAQLVGVLMIALLTLVNMRGLHLGKLIQNIFTTAKTAALAGLIVIGILLGWKTGAWRGNLEQFFTIQGQQTFAWDLSAASALGLFIGICVAQTNSLFSADAWHNVTFTAGEARNPRRDIPLSLALGTGLVIGLYLLANVAYLTTLSFHHIQNVPEDRVASETLQVLIPNGAFIMAAAIMVSTFGCNNGLILMGSRAYYAMARDGLFFRQAGRLNKRHVPAWGLILQGVWAAILVLPRVVKGVDPKTGAKILGNLYGNLLDYVISAALIFYILTIASIFRLRYTRPDAERPYRAFGYPWVPLAYIAGAAVILVVLFIFKGPTTWPGLVIVATGFPVYFLWRIFGKPSVE
jgi:APA family basic amino acid/polyamine antiporter